MGMTHVMTLDRGVYDKLMEHSDQLPRRVGRPYVIAVVLTLARYVKSTGIVDLTIDQLIEMTGLSKSQIQRSLDLATRAGVIETQKRGGGLAHRGSRRVWLLGRDDDGQTITRPLQQPDVPHVSSPDAHNSRPARKISTPQWEHSRRDPHGSSPAGAWEQSDRERMERIEELIVKRRHAQHYGRIDDADSWRAAVKKDVHRKLQGPIRDLLRRFPTAPDEALADAAELETTRGLAMYTELLKDDPELDGPDRARRRQVLDWVKRARLGQVTWDTPDVPRPHQ